MWQSGCYPRYLPNRHLTDHELMLALGERNCFDAIHVAHANMVQ